MGLRSISTQRLVIYGQLRASEGSPHFDIATSGNEHIAFRDGGLDGDINMLIDGGNVGIGTASPEHAFMLVLIQTNSEFRAALVGRVSPCALQWRCWRIWQSANSICAYTSGADRMIVKGDGKVGIGTTNPLLP